MNYLEIIKRTFRELYGCLSVEELILNRQLANIIADIEAYFEAEAVA